MKHFFTRSLMIGASALAFMAYANISMASVVVDGVNYDLNKNKKTAKVVKSPEKYAGEVLVPETIVYNEATYKVTAIDSCAFLDCDALTSIVIGNNVQTIGYSAFERCYNLAEVTFGSKLWFLDFESFKNCKSLEFVFLPNSLTYIANDAFYGCSNLVFVELGEKTAYIGQKAFAGTNIFSLAIPQSVKTLDLNFLSEPWIKQVIAEKKTPLKVASETFGGVDQPACTLYVPAASVEAYKAADYWKEFGVISPIVDDVIYGCVLDGICYNLYPESKSAEVIGVVNTSIVEIPEQIIFDDDNAYQVSTICKYAFAGCTNVEYVTIPATIGYIGEYAFKGCTGLKEIYNYSMANYTELNAFEGSNYQNATVYVEEVVLDLYKATSPWADFKEVLPFTTTGISEVSTINQNTEYFDSYGQKIEGLKKGINIIKVGNETKKVIVK